MVNRCYIRSVDELLKYDAATLAEHMTLYRKIVWINNVNVIVIIKKNRRSNSLHKLVMLNFDEYK